MDTNQTTYNIRGLTAKSSRDVRLANIQDKLSQMGLNPVSRNYLYGAFGVWSVEEVPFQSDLDKYMDRMEILIATADKP